MPTLDTIPAEQDAVHLLLIGDTKAGKSTYAAEAAIDGFELIYIDADNGLSALRNRIKHEQNPQDIMKRVNYFAPAKPVSFVTEMLKSSAKKPMVWLPNQDRRMPRMEKEQKQLVQDSSDEPVWIIDMTAVPRTTIFSVDSWTSFAADALGVLGPNQMSSLLDGSADQSAYGEARMQLLYITNLLQQLHCHVIVQAHGTIFEIYKKPPGSTGAIQQRDLVLVDTVDVPVSSSRNHGKEMGSRFNHIGRLVVNNVGAVEIDFTRKPNAVSGGPPNRKDKASRLRFKDLVGDYKVDIPARPWYTETTVKEYFEAIAAEKKRRTK